MFETEILNWGIKFTVLIIVYVLGMLTYRGVIKERLDSAARSFSFPLDASNIVNSHNTRAGLVFGEYYIVHGRDMSSIVFNYQQFCDAKNELKNIKSAIVDMRLDVSHVENIAEQILDQINVPTCKNEADDD